MNNDVRKEIAFTFSPYKYESQEHLIEKSDDKGRKRCYVAGISSGSGLDGHGERMTEKCVRSFMNQANSGNVLLYPDVHGIKASEDIGILTKAELQPNGDWYTEYRLYDEFDDMDQATIDKAKKIWKQLKGLPPYKKPKQKGFSIEGFIPEGSILSSEKDADGNVTKRVIDDVLLDGVVIVPRPAYQASIAQGVYKALGEMEPKRKEQVRKNLQESLESQIKDKETENSFYKRRWEIGDALDDNIRKIMIKDTPDRKERLELLFDEYKNLMTSLILSSEAIFSSGESTEEDGAPYGDVAKPSKVEVLKMLLHECKKLKKALEAK